MSLNLSSVDLFNNGKWGANNPNHSLASQLIKLLPGVNAEKMSAEIRAWEPSCCYSLVLAQ